MKYLVYQVYSLGILVCNAIPYRIQSTGILFNYVNSLYVCIDVYLFFSTLKTHSMQFSHKIEQVEVDINSSTQV